jgi:hypothetical protein
VGRKLRTEGWPPGPYLGEVRLMRGADAVSAMSITIAITP